MARQAESGPPETSATPRDPSAIRPLPRTVSARRSRTSVSRVSRSISANVATLAPHPPGRGAFSTSTAVRKKPHAARRPRRMRAPHAASWPRRCGVRRARLAAANAPYVQGGRQVDALQLDLADRLEIEVLGLAHRLDDGVGDQDLAGERASDDSVGEIDVTAEVVAIAVDGLAVMDADPRLGSLLE